jgi:xanthine dehydrogenase accessory factor
MNMHNLHWSEAVQRCHRDGEACVLATVMGVAGSTPREPGAKMVITATTIYSTIGGGQLEFAVMLKARALLDSGAACQRIEAFPLAAAGQCCGGNVSVLLELLPGAPWQVWVYGAGHVAQQLIAVLGGLPCQVRWCDSRAGLFPASVPANVRTLHADDSVATLQALPASADVLVLTHDHALDFALTHAALSRGNWVGLIGSATKAARFRQRLQRAGISAAQLQQLQCPVGRSDIPGKLPMEIAVSIAAELICRHRSAAPPRRRGADWREIKALLTV